MKSFIILVLAVLLMAGIALADETDRGNYVTPISPLTNFLNENNCFYHTHNYDDDQRNAIEAGVGLDLLLYEWEDARWLSEVNLEMRKDLVDMERFSTYLVLKADVTSVFDFLKK